MTCLFALRYSKKTCDGLSHSLQDFIYGINTVSLLAYISFVNISQKSMVASIFNLKNIVQVDASFAGTKNIEKLYTSNSIVVLEDLKTKNNKKY